jgi:hypothetical protein
MSYQQSMLWSSREEGRDEGRAEGRKDRHCLQAAEAWCRARVGRGQHGLVVRGY